MNTELPLAEEWVGGAEWALQSTVAPKGATSSSFAGVSCPSTLSCAAAGTFVELKKGQTLIESTTTTKWTVQSAPGPKGVKARGLGKVSCTSSTHCLALGGYTSTEGVKGVYGVLWNGSEWTLQTIPTPVGGKEPRLSDLSCPSSTECTATGSYVNGSSVTVSLAERWNGKEWLVQTTVNPSGAKETQLNGGSCVSTTCIAVGSYVNSEGAKLTLAERWNGKEWSLQTSANPKGGKEDNLHSVSCVTTEECTAVGQYKNSEGTVLTLAERWNGKEWSLQTTTNPSATENRLLSVSCTSSTACTAVGEDKITPSIDGTLIEHWSGKEWLTQTSAQPSESDNHLADVSCVSSTNCVAIGEYINAASEWVGLALAINGGEWGLAATFEPSTSKETLMGGVSCTTSTECTAVGSTLSGGGVKEGLVERYA